MRRLICLVLLGAAPVHADPDPYANPPEEARPPPPPPPPTPFDQGKFGLSFGAGSQNTLGAHYYGVAGGMGYYVLDGVELGLGMAHQWGDGPSITRLTPSLRYIAQPLVRVSPVVPYVGVFGSRYFIYEGNDDVNTVGGRAGLVYVGGQIVFGLGIAVEQIVSECTEDCTSYYPDFTLSLSL
jgi:hypothetical protein